MALISTSQSDTLAQRLVPQQGILANKALQNTALVIVGCLLTALLARIRIYLRLPRCQ